MKIKNFIQSIQDASNKYGLKILLLDFTDITVFSRIGFSHEVFIQIYINAKKQKTNLALIVAGDRVYGIDNEGGGYHEHPFAKPELHIDTEQIDVDDFIVKSLEYLKTMNLLG
ncbi:MAG: hypothetical protein HZC49_11710 [Nitrospirae bacterium]|nr:hypothetical protein [Nitrospirota bacterium]